MKQKLLYIDAEGRLYRGFGRYYPIIVWIEKARRWVPSLDFGVPPDGWGVLVTKAEAERCYPGSTGAPLPAGTQLERDLSFAEMVRYRPELFDGYDGIITRKSPDEEKRYFDAVVPVHVKKLIEKRREKRSKR